ncbi:MAG: hypothetical protein ACR2LC_09525 [Pyrinomonadaceae bacterium]
MSKPEVELKGHVFVIADDEMSMRKCEEMYRRIQSALVTLDGFTKAISSLNEDDPKLADKCANIMTVLTTKIVEIYPTPAYLDADLETFKQMTVRRSQNGKDN